MDADLRADRAATFASLGLIALNVALTGRWADVPGGMRGWRWPLVAAAIVFAALPAMRRRNRTSGRPGVAPARVWPGRLSAILLWTGVIVLAGEFLLEWLPPSAWGQIPFADDWPPRFASTVDGLALLRRGAFGGWQWNLLGGYATATDITQSLTLLGALPMAILGDRVGFHVLHLILFAAIPALVFVDLRGARERAAAAGLVAWSSCAFAWGMIRNGDTNSLAGVVCVLAVLAASHAARRGARFGFAALVLALTLTAFSHLAFLAYAIGLLAVEAVYYADRRQLGRSAAAVALALLASLPVTFELLRYPAEFRFNNVLFEPGGAVDWIGVLRRIGYNVQILCSPWRWFSDTTKLFLPIVVLAAWRRAGRAGFYAWGALFALGLTLLNVPEAGYVFVRPAHLLVVLTPVVVAAFLVTRADGPVQAGALAALVILSVPIAGGFAVPHEPSVEAFAPALVERIRAADGEMVLLENNPHREVSAVPGEHSEKSLYGTHYEALVPAATGKRLYAGYWDGWQFTPFRGEMLAGGAWQGHLLANGDRPAFLRELQKWGVRSLFVWSRQATAVLATWPELTLRWSEGPWREFELTGAPVDTRSVVTGSGRGELVDRGPLGATVRLTDVRVGDPIVVRTHFHPAWQARDPSGALALVDIGGQLGFSAPADGSYDVRLTYPSHRVLLLVSAAVLGFVLAAGARRRGRRG